jgi:predicted Ser/Thr protein kinase
MPARRDLGEGIGVELGDLYATLEREIAAGLAQRLRSGLDQDDWSRRKLAALADVRRFAATLTNRAARRAAGLSRAVVTEAFRRGSMEGLRDVGRPERGGDLPGQRGIDRLALALQGRLDGTVAPIVRSATDAYQRTAAAPVALVLGGALTRRQAAERQWNSLLDQGFTAFTDARGRRWSAAGYTEMATRTATAQAAVQGHLDRLESLGLDLIIVSDSPQECERCRPWEGKVLQRGGAGGRRTLEAESELTGEPVTVQIAGSVTEAISAGLLHPNCRHTMGAYLPGLTRIPTDTEDPEGDKARQQLRYLEREQRRWRLREAGAMTDEAKAAAAAKVKARGAQIKAHMKANPTLTPRPDRQRIDLGNTRRPGEGDTRATLPTSNIPRDPMREALDSGVVSERQLGGGITARVDRVETRDGVSMVRKLARDSSGRPAVEQQDAEELGALVARAVGARAPRVLRTGPDEVHMALVEGRTWAELDEVTQATVAATEEARAMALTDMLIGNVDRNPGNLIITERGTPWAIDHGGAFEWHPHHNPISMPSYARNVFRELFAVPGTRRWVAGALREGEGAAIRTELAALRPEFERMGRLDWYDGMLGRLKAMEEAT